MTEQSSLFESAAFVGDLPPNYIETTEQTALMEKAIKDRDKWARALQGADPIWTNVERLQTEHRRAENRIEKFRKKIEELKGQQANG
jgi:hypothetical protein